MSCRTVHRIAEVLTGTRSAKAGNERWCCQPAILCSQVFRCGNKQRYERICDCGGRAQKPATGCQKEADLLSRRAGVLHLGNSVAREDGAGGGRSEEHTLNSSHVSISYAVFCLKKKTT